jgi:ADP-ribose pyrophosphatase YjhB (NUDIX family)
VLLVRRADSGAWTPVTGIVDLGEEPAVAAEREVLEEADVVAHVEALSWVKVIDPVTYPNGDRSRYLDLVFRAGWCPVSRSSPTARTLRPPGSAGCAAGAVR